MDAGELKERVNILNLISTSSGYVWVSESSVWAKAEKKDKNNIFSSTGKGAKTVTFNMRRRQLSLHNALRWRGQHCYITNINDTDRFFLEVTAALIEPMMCSITRTISTTSEFNRLVYVEGPALSFPACVTEKYLGHTQGEPQATLEQRYVLVTPKPVKLFAGELVSVGSLGIFNILIPHELDEYKNEHEIIRKAEP